jgi:hypothetical protein
MPPMIRSRQRRPWTAYDYTMLSVLLLIGLPTVGLFVWTFYPFVIDWITN